MWITPYCNLVFPSKCYPQTLAELARQHEPFKRSVGLEQSDQQAIWNYGIWNYGITELWNYGIMKLWNYGLQHPPGKGCSTPLVEGAAPPSRGSSTPWQREQHPLAEGAAPPGRGSSTPWQRVQHPLALILAPSEVLDFAKLLMYLSSQVHLWSSVLWMLEEYYMDEKDLV